MICSAIDIGTNTVLLLVAETEGNSIQVIHEEQRIPRLGKGVDAGKTLQTESTSRVMTALAEYHDILQIKYPDALPPVITATSAVRDATNREDFLSKVHEKFGWKVRLLSGSEEADCTYFGSISTLSLTEGERVAVIDIGGGSTEIAVGTSEKLEFAQSLDMGSVRFTERFFSSNPPADLEKIAAQKEVNRLLNTLKLPDDISRVIGVAGTVTSVAAIESGLSEYDASRINGMVLSLDTIETYLNKFSTTSADEIEHENPVFLKGRGDLIAAGLLILKSFISYAGKDKLTVSTGGIRHGAILMKNKGAL
jgi:exopolyphosphatase/guanosine-5'-triphosphate,3'-diphosphate pyrophosphatase